jgi:2-polyprenyl-6-methoxyphenol hydroxylase-like FAD-dependent oxidoreductase
MGQVRVLICGAGIAGSTLAFWLARRGFQVSVVERSHGLRSSGAPVDVHGLAIDVPGAWVSWIASRNAAPAPWTLP